jgi:hypothetical protein
MSPPRATDWDSYYRRPFWLAGLTRRHTGRVLLRLCRRFAPPKPAGLVMVELGGADSCFYDLLTRELRPREYHVIDQHRPGLEKLEQRLAPGVETFLHHGDILEPGPRLAADVVFSVGLIEHLEPADLARAVRAHFDLVSPQGVVIISFPTPTWLYRAARRAAEAVGLWIFHDERPLALAEVSAALAGRGVMAHSQVIWPIVFTQAALVARPVAAAAAAGPGQGAPRGGSREAD